MRKLLALVLCCLTFGSLFLLPASAEEPGFVGSRVVEYVADKSDIDNFIDGGRSAFELVLRSSMPSWAVYQLRSDGRDLRLSLQFDFTSYDEYTARLTELLTYAPSIVCLQEEKLMLLEGHGVMDLLGSVQSALAARDCLREKPLADLFRVRKNEITVNGEVYQAEDRLAIRPAGDMAVRFDYVDIDTQEREDGSFSRTITVSIDDPEEHARDLLLGRFKEAGRSEVITDETYMLKLRVEFGAGSEEELLEKTMACLGQATSIAQQQEYLDSRTVAVQRTEFFDLESMMTENGSFCYRHTYPSYVEALQSTMEEAEVYDQTLTVYDAQRIVCQYNRAFRFSSIELHTALPDYLGKIKKTITFTVPVKLAEGYHDRIKEELQAKLCRGSVLHIYDENAMRRYEISFSSYFTKDIGKFTRSLLGDGCTFHYKTSWLPFGKSIVTENVDAGQVFSWAIAPEEVKVSYELPELASGSKIKTQSAGEKNADGSVTVDASDKLTVSFTSPDLLKTALELVVLLAAAVTVLVYRIKKKKKAAKEKKEEEVL